ncbi:MAG: hypothetical protein LBU89_15005 [Fibromonadaceae bacterium]|jgi:hypothetical protein|nr:hypothetical protein [Fibromonadaceae bacterium]
MSSGVLVIIIIAVILLLVMILAGIGFYIIVRKSDKERETEEVSKIALSGKYSVALRPVAESLAEKKPGMAKLEEWLNTQSISEEQKKKYLKDWQTSIEKTIKTINEGDMNGVTAYRIEIGKKDSEICKFLHPDNFVTRNQINSNAEILPPYYFGSDSVIMPKQPDGTGWKSVTPKDGSYEVPSWQQIV